MGVLLTPGRRLVNEVLQVMAVSHEATFAQSHHVLNRAVWSPLTLAQVLLNILVKTFRVAEQTLVFGIDETIERRWDKQISARGICRDPVRSSKSHFVKVSGLRWISLILLMPIPWAEQIWALPFMTVLSPSERYYQQLRRTPKSLLARILQMVHLLRCWLPRQRLIVVGDSAYAALDFLSAVQALHLTFVTRLRHAPSLQTHPLSASAGFASRRCVTAAGHSASSAT